MTCPSDSVLEYPYPNACMPCYFNCLTCAGPSPSECLTCLAGYYLEGDRCEACHAYCLTCSGSSAFDCLTCPAGYVLELGTAPGYCKSNLCAIKNYNANDCSTCDSSCLTCTGPASTDCYTCPLGIKLVVTNMSCVLDCQQQTYYNSTSMNCLPCDPSCLFCSGPAATECTECLALNHFVQVNTSLCGLDCTPRSYPEPLTPHFCQPCDDSCETCTGATSTACASCYDPLLLDYDKSCQVQCSPGYFEVPVRKCISCTYNCKNCTDFGFYNCNECFDDRYLRVDGACILKCLPGFYYENSTDSCRVCDVSCKNCTGPTQNDCISCADKFYVQQDNSCKNYCPAGTFVSEGTHCKVCDLTCETCTDETKNDCIVCALGLFMIEGTGCFSECEPFTFPEATTRKCVGCHSTCLSCSGLQKTQCLTCLNEDIYTLTPEGECIDCYNKADEFPSLCTFSSQLKLSDVPISLADELSSTTLELSFKDSGLFYEKILSLNISNFIQLNVSELSTSEYKWKLSGKQQKILISLNFTKDQALPSLVTVTPLVSVILRSKITNKTELIFVNKSASIKVTVQAPQIRA
jgi:proprotein convertase subtilisin/kexin type 5